MSMFSPFLSPLKCHQLFWLFRTIFGYLLTGKSIADYLSCVCCEELDRTDNSYAKNSPQVYVCKAHLFKEGHIFLAYFSIIFQICSGTELQTSKTLEEYGLL